MKSGKNFGKKLRRLRTEAGMTQAQLVVASGVSACSISLFESGHALPSEKTAMKLLAVLTRGEPVGADFGGKGEPLQVFPKPTPAKKKEPRLALAPGVVDLVDQVNGMPSPVRLGKVSRDWLNMAIDNQVAVGGHVLVDGPSRFVIIARAGLTTLCADLLKACGIRTEG